MGSTHVAYSDESQWNIGRYRSIGMTSCSQVDHQGMNEELVRLLDGSDVLEFKWEKLRTAKYRFAALKLIDFAFKHADSERLRVDVIIWDIEDSRHKVCGRDDSANFGRMYFHLFRDVLTNRWSDELHWRLCPDEHSELDWDTIESCLSHKGRDLDMQQDLFSKCISTSAWRELYRVQEVTPCRSLETHFIQLSDLFAGLAAYSYEHFDSYKECLSQSTGQTRLELLFDDGPIELSPGDKEKCSVLAKFNTECKKRRLQVALDSTNGLYSNNPDVPFNFWLYRPQREEDTAPLKRER